MTMELRDIANYVNDKISSEIVTIENYVTTDSLLPNKLGRTIATNLPPKRCTLTKYQAGDVLVANIRPYLKKIWYADSGGGASADVLVFRTKNGHSSKFLYAILMQDSFYDWAMKGPKGSRMPRGDKSQIMRFPIRDLGSERECLFGNLINDIDAKISLNRQINRNLCARREQKGNSFSLSRADAVNGDVSRNLEATPDHSSATAGVRRAA